MPRMKISNPAAAVFVAIAGDRDQDVGAMGRSRACVIGSVETDSDRVEYVCHCR